MTTRTVTDDDGEWLEHVDAAGRVRGRELRVPSAAFTAKATADAAPAQTERAAEGPRRAQINAMLAKLDARTATNAEIQATLAAIIRHLVK